MAACLKNRIVRSVWILLFFIVFLCLISPTSGTADSLQTSGQTMDKKPTEAEAICDVKREMYVPSPGPGVASIVSMTYLGKGLRLREIRGHEAKSDLGEKYRVRFSENNGRTWSPWTAVALGTDSLRQKNIYMEESPFAIAYDPESERTIEVLFQRIFLGEPSAVLAAYWRGEHRFADHCFYRLSRDDGRTWTDRCQLIYETDSVFNPKNWADPGFFQSNQMYGGYDITPLRDGRIVYPAVVPVPYREDEAERKICAKVPWYAGKDRVDGVGCFFGKWNPRKNDYDWTFSKPVFVPRRVSTRGLEEPTVTELRGGKLLLEMRGSNVYLDPVLFPGRKWISVSADGGQTWGAVVDFRYDTGEPFYAPATFAKFIRSRRTGKLYWIGNISRGPAEGNSPRYPLYIAEVDEAKVALRRKTLTVIDDLRPGDTKGLQLSNFTLLENRETLDFEIYLSRLGEKPDNVFSASAYRYTLKLK
jgi:hypothetical protein